MTRIGLLIPTKDEAVDAPTECAAYGFGPGKSAACAAAAQLVFQDNCDMVLVWGTAGGIHARCGEALVATHVAFSDYDLGGLFGSTGIGYVPDFTETSGWAPLEDELCERLLTVLRDVFPELPCRRGRICSSDTFALPAPPAQYNRIQAAADAVDMESAAVAHFLRLCAPHVRLGVLRVVSNEPNQEGEFSRFLAHFCKLNPRLAELRRRLLS